MKIIIDTNILLSFLLVKGSKVELAVKTAFAKGEVLYSIQTLKELERVVFLSKFDRYVSKKDRKEFIEFYKQIAKKINVTHKVKVCRDPRDNMFLELARSSSADIILTGDTDLLEIGNYFGTEIVNPKDFIF